MEESGYFEGLLCLACFRYVLQAEFESLSVGVAVL